MHEPTLHHYRLPPSVAVGYGDIDAEHQGLIDVLNQALQTLPATGGGDPVLILPILAILCERLTVHFRHEEQEMEKLEYPELLQHSVHHLGCLQRLEDVRDAVAAKEKSIDCALLDELFDLVLDDIIRADSGFKSFLFSKDLCTDMCA